MLIDMLTQMIQWTIDFVEDIWLWVQNAIAYLAAVIQYVWDTLVAVGQWVLDHVSVLIDGLRKAARAVGRGFNAVLHLNFRKIWDAVKRGYDRLRRALDWYMKHVQGPIDRLRRQVMEIYNRFFKPILRVLDTFRVMVRMVAVFNRKLAAKLDSRLFALESKLMWPITATLKRLNELSSHLRAIITAMGYLDRVLVLETLRRDALLVWEVLTNPRGRIFDKPTPPATRTVADMKIDFHVFTETGGGVYGDYAEHGREVFRDALGGLA